MADSLESISSSSIEDLSVIDGFDEDISNLLINRAKEVSDYGYGSFN